MANMMKLTVKTLDSINHFFQVETEATVLQLKHQIRESLSLEIDQQRLIFCGRVLQDDQKLNDCGVNDGKCLHLVQRPPPSPPSRRRERDRERLRERENTRREAGGRHAGGSPLRHHIRHLLGSPADLVFDQQQSMSMTPTNGRMEFIRRMITEIRESLDTLRTHIQVMGGSGEMGEPPIEPMDVDSDQNEVPNNREAYDFGDEEDNDDPPSSGSIGRRSRDFRATRARYASRPRDLGQLIEELDLLHDDFAPYRTQYVATLRDLSIETLAEQERLYRQRTVTLINDIMHSFAHAYHSISDITFHVGQRYPRLTSEPPSASRYPMPMQAHINVVTTTGRRSMSGDGRSTTAARAPSANTTTTTTAAAAPAAPATTATVASTVTPTSSVTAASTATVTAPTNVTSATVTGSGVNIENTADTLRRAAAAVVAAGVAAGTPVRTSRSYSQTGAAVGASPRRFQVEIETRGHIAFPIDNSLLNGLAAVASNLHQAEQGQQELASAAPSAPPPVESATPTPEPASAPAPSAAPADIRPERATRSEPITRDERTILPERAPRTARLYRTRPSGQDPVGPFSFVEPDNSTRSEPRILPETYARRVEREPRGPSSSDSSRPSTPPEGGQRSTSMPTVLPTTATSSQRNTQQAAPRTVPAAATRPLMTGSTPRPPDTRGTENEPRALTDLENLLRNLSQGGGVEVVMSMEDMPGFMHGNLFDSDNEHNGVYVTPIVAGQGGINHSTEFLHNIIANVVRQNIGGALLLQGQNLTGLSGSTQGLSQNQGQTQNRQPSNTSQRQTTQGQTPSQRQAAAAGPERNTTQGQTPNQETGSDQGQNQQNRLPGQRQQWQAPRNTTQRRSSDRVHSLMMACMVYDRHLPCDSQYARRHLQERREHYQAQAEAQERIRASRAPAPVLEVLMSRNRRFSPSHMAAMMRLLGGPVCEEGQLNAFMITIARHLFLNPMNENPNDPMPMPSEFPFIRMQLREYVQGMLETAIETGVRTNTFEAVTERIIAQNLTFLRNIPREHVPRMVDLAMLHDGFTGDNAFDPIADYYVERHSDFLRNMHSITSIDSDIDAIASVRVMTRSRLPAIIACVMSEASSDMFAARFYSVFARFFTDMCTLFLCFCTEGFDGLLLVFDSFIARITENYDRVTRDWLRTISRENLLAIRDNLEPNIETTVRQYFRRADGSMPPPTDSPRRRGDVVTIETTVNETSPLDEEDAETQGSISPYLEAASLPRVDGESSSTISPELRSPGELTIPRSESPFRGWDNSSPVDPHGLAGLDSPNLPGGIITIGLGSSSNSSLYDPDENNDDFLDADGPDDYEFTEMQRTLLDRQLNLLEDEEENLEVDVVNDDGVPVHLPGRSRRPDPYAALSQAAMRVDASRLRVQALRRSRLDPTAFAMHQLELRMEQRVMEQSARESAADAQLLVALERLQHIADMQTREAHELAERMRTSPSTDAPSPELINDFTPPPDRIRTDYEPAEADSEYSTPPANAQPPTSEEPEFLEPNEPDRTASPTIHPIYHIDMSEPEFLVPINNLRNRLNSMPRNEGSANEQDRLSPDEDRLIINEDVINEDVDFFSDSDSDIRANESGENSGYLTPFSRNRADIDYSTAQSIPRTDSNESMPEAPQEEDDDSDFAWEHYESALHRMPSRDRGTSSQPPGVSREEEVLPEPRSGYSRLQRLVRHKMGIRDDAQPNPPTVPQVETETKNENVDSREEEVLPEPRSGYSRLQRLVRHKMGIRDDAQPNPPTVPQVETETKNENVDPKSSNEDAAMASAQTPMESVFEHFESNWAPVFREDEAAQARPTRPQEPFSDAYLSGMPSRKRRCVREARPDPSLEGLMTEGVGATGVDDERTEELREFLRESVRSLVRHRSQREPENFSTSQFQNTAAFIDTDKPTKEEEESAAAATASAPVDTASAPNETQPPDLAE